MIEIQRNDIFKNIQDIIVDLSGEQIEASFIKPESNIISDLGFDSLDVLDIMEKLEKIYKSQNLEFNATDAFDLKTPNDIIDLTISMLEKSREEN